MSGAGKTTLLEALATRGYLAIDTDYDNWTLASGLWDEPRMAGLLAANPTVVVSGTTENQVRFHDDFDDVVLLSAPVDVLVDRARRRTNNPYGRTPEHEAEIRGYVRDVEPRLRRSATLELDGRSPVEDLADAVEALLRQ
jgi:shikimate kinase